MTSYSLKSLIRFARSLTTAPFSSRHVDKHPCCVSVLLSMSEEKISFNHFLAVFDSEFTSQLQERGVPNPQNIHVFVAAEFNKLNLPKIRELAEKVGGSLPAADAVSNAMLNKICRGAANGTKTWLSRAFVALLLDDRHGVDVALAYIAAADAINKKLGGEAAVDALRADNSLAPGVFRNDVDEKLRAEFGHSQQVAVVCLILTSLFCLLARRQRPSLTTSSEVARSHFVTPCDPR